MPTARAGDTTCAVLATGVLNADTTIYSDPFSIENNTLSFDPAIYFAMPPVSFEACTPNFEGYSNSDIGVNGTYAGHLYVADLDMCLGVEDVDSLQPYNVTTMACPTKDSKTQNAANWVMIDQKIYWGGKTRADGTKYQGGDGCEGSGLFGYQGTSEAIPAVIGVTPLVCASWEDVYGFILLPLPSS
ncbi:hypothetical protein HYDPIDRAFT_174690 [Hydnomerulius pinastri MD-312]|nr:hypothetical protein HYDPIDRAFT_174690 [Hydnomerulius pinastri MD-312]